MLLKCHSQVGIYGQVNWSQSGSDLVRKITLGKLNSFSYFVSKMLNHAATFGSDIHQAKIININTIRIPIYSICHHFSRNQDHFSES